MKFRGEFKVENLQPFVGCLLSLSSLCSDLVSTSSCFLKLTQQKIAIILRTSAFIDAFVEIDSTELFHFPFVLESRTSNVIVLKVNITSFHESLSAATNSSSVSIKLKRHDEGGALSISFPDPTYPSISVVLDVIVTPTNEYVTLESVIPTIPPCSVCQIINIMFIQCNIGLLKLQSIITFLESSKKIGNDITEVQVIRPREAESDDILIHNQTHNSAIVKLSSSGLLANLETYFYGMQVFSSLPPDELPSRSKNESIKALLKTDTAYLLCKNAIESTLVCKNEALLVAVHNGGFNKRVFAVADYESGPNPFTLKKLEFEYDALAPEISEETVKFHYLKHHAGYVNKLNSMVKDNPEISTKSIKELVETATGPLYNMAAQIWNHDFYWECLSPKSNIQDAPMVQEEIKRSFGSFENFQEQLIKAVGDHFGSGWVWLIYDKAGPQKLKLVATRDAENPMRLWVLKPILVIGPDSLDALKILTKRKDVDNAEIIPRKANFTKIFSVFDGNEIDRVITIYFPAPNSYTGEDVVEIHSHGSKSVVEEIFANLREISASKKMRLRQAEKGEFTRRAFYNGKLDLTQAEGIRDLISSDTALKRMDAMLKVWVTQYGLDIYRFKEICQKYIKKVEKDLVKLKENIANYLNDRRGEVIENGINVLLLGPPNAGKSTFMNTLFERDVSIVSSVAGTTRDVIQLSYNCKQLNLQVMDTTGIRPISYFDYGNTLDSHDAIEAEGIKRTLMRMENAHVVIFFFDHTNAINSKEALEKCFQNATNNTRFFICICKSDLIINSQNLQSLEKEIEAEFSHCLENYKCNIVHLCNTDKTNVDRLIDMINKSIQDELKLNNIEHEAHENHPFVLNERHRSNLQKVIAAIDVTLKELSYGHMEIEIVAEYIREIINQIGYLVGEQTNEQVLDEIFETYCIGK
ncbi:bifunctional Manganese-iron superoxide dismutase [Babesia duncani]|uniref:superoxide dismutase n=1 Tax=Babesia duncani TaxID=323732 RepID=A0AAD9PMA2_9APIC|nr:bifunctional Manganese-iron superoxide dismutase [Babesia duncani]